MREVPSSGSLIGLELAFELFQVLLVAAIQTTLTLHNNSSFCNMLVHVKHYRKLRSIVFYFGDLYHSIKLI